MGSDWKNTTAIADGFNAYDDLPERVLGYPTVFDELHLEAEDVHAVLDYGCGPGKAAFRAANRFDVDVLGVDISPSMLAIARQQRAHPRIRYLLIDATRLSPVVADGSVDAAMACYVFINIGDLDDIRIITAEIFRVLRPGGRFTVLDTNPDTTGVRFSTFQSGESGHTYDAGQQRRVLLHHLDGSVLELADHHWPRPTYLEVLGDAGFGHVTVSEPLLGDVGDHQYAIPGSLLDTSHPAEGTRPPFLVVTGVK